MSHDWPGNVRELRNVLRRAVILSRSHIAADALELIGAAYRLPHAEGSLPPANTPRLADGYGPSPVSLDHMVSPDLLPLVGQTFEQIERVVIDWALRRNGGSRRRAARALEMARSTFCDKVKRYGIA